MWQEIFHFLNYIFFSNYPFCHLLPYYVHHRMCCWSMEALADAQFDLDSWPAPSEHSRAVLKRKQADVYSVERKTSKGKVNIKDIHSYYGMLSYVKR